MIEVPKISIVIVSLNVREILRANLNRLFALPNKYSFEVFLIDNGSTDGSARMVRDQFPPVQLIQNDYNSGFSHACNQGLRLAKGEVLVLFNPDMLMGEKVLEQTYDTLMGQKDIGVMGVRLMSPDGLVVQSVRNDPMFFDQMLILLKLARLFPQSQNRYLAKNFDYSKSQNVEQVRGSYFAFRREVMEKVGLLDELYFVWFEEVDFCRRVRKAGYRIWFDSNVYCTDIVGGYFKQVPARIKQYNFINSMRKYFAKWHPQWQSAIITILLPLAVLFGVIIDGINKVKSLRKAA